MMLRVYRYSCHKRLFSSCQDIVPHVCIIGSGPAGFYAAQQVIKSHESAKVDIYERLPVPFGLVRYGVAPDHPEVKNCISTFTNVAQNGRVSFIGNVKFGQDVDLSLLRLNYHAVVLAYGASEERKLGIPGENLPDVISAKDFVGWYNGLPEDTNLPVNFDTESVAVIGHGNVALDVARILLKPLKLLRETDIPENVLHALSKSRVRRVALIGRRNVEHVAFTIKELRELINLPNTQPILDRRDFSHLPEILPNVPKQRKRLMELLARTALNVPTEVQSREWTNAGREWSLRFMLSPISIVPNSLQGIQGVQCTLNRLVPEGNTTRAVPTEDKEFVQCGLVIRSIGYRGVRPPSELPYDERKGIVSNIDGRVVGHPDIYVSGWVGSGPVGVLLTTMSGAFNTGKLLAGDLKDAQLGLVSKVKAGQVAIFDHLSEKGIEPVTFSDWTRLDQYEVQSGSKLGKPREKVTSVSEMLKIIHRT